MVVGNTILYRDKMNSGIKTEGRYFVWNVAGNVIQYQTILLQKTSK